MLPAAAAMAPLTRSALSPMAAPVCSALPSIAPLMRSAASITASEPWRSMASRLPQKGQVTWLAPSGISTGPPQVRQAIWVSFMAALRVWFGNWPVGPPCAGRGERLAR